MALVGVDKVAAALNIDARRVQQLAKEGVFTGAKAKHGQYDLAKCMLLYIRYLQDALKHRGQPTDDSVKAQRERLLKAQADREEISLAKDRGELIPVEVYEEEMSRHIEAVRQRFLLLPANAAPHLEGEDRTTIKLRLEAEVRKIMSMIANDSHEHDAHHGGSASGTAAGAGASAQKVGAAANHHRKRVGRKK